ncbi:DUF664 domain-containing protein [Streptomyces sp. NPDC090445]|uniref:mycothiol transferase n=1 Tax=Streptomyces sp. NPDC090445 TaxID=3365963 RepID=UPI0037F7DB14
MLTQPGKPLQETDLTPSEERREVTLHHVVVRVIAETHRHAGHADIVRELIDGSAGELKGKDSMPPGDEAWWQDYRRRLERVAQEAGTGCPLQGRRMLRPLLD